MTINVELLNDLIRMKEEDYNDFITNTLTSEKRTELLKVVWRFFDKNYVNLESEFYVKGFAVPEQLKPMLAKLFKTDTRSIGGKQLYDWMCKALNVDKVIGIKFDKAEEKKEVELKK